MKEHNLQYLSHQWVNGAIWRLRLEGRIHI